MAPQRLAGRVIAIPESREIDVFAALLERRGARVIRCPLLAIRDAPDPRPVLDWGRALAGGGFDDLILLTGEGLRRILSCIERHEPALRSRFIEALARVRKITRGPKPARALRELGLKPQISAVHPTTEGVVTSLRGHALAGRRIGVQLYGTEPNRPLIDFLVQAGAQVSSVAPYVYAAASEEQAVRELVERLHAGGIDAIAFTASAQVERLFAIASEDGARSALARTWVAAIGPVVAQTLRRHGVEARSMPAESFFLKPLTRALEEALGAGAALRRPDPA